MKTTTKQKRVAGVRALLMHPPKELCLFNSVQKRVAHLALPISNIVYYFHTVSMQFCENFVKEILLVFQKIKWQIYYVKVSSLVQSRE